MQKLLIVALVVGACGGGGGAGGGGDDWTSKPIKTVAATVDGIAFTIDLPDGMRQKAEDGGVHFDFLVGEYVKTPEVTVRAGGFAKTLEDYLKSEASTKDWLRKDTLPDGYITSAENSAYKGKEDYLVYAYRTAGDKVLTCQARVTPWSRGATTKDKVPLVEKMCLSLKFAK